MTIGWGHAVTVERRQLKGKDGLKKSKALYPQGITYDEAQDLLISDVALAVKAVQRWVTAQLSQPQFDALVSWHFNTGGLMLNTGPSTVLKLINEGQLYDAAQAMLQWNKITDPKTKQKVVSRGLVNRRADEVELWHSEDY